MNPQELEPNHRILIVDDNAAIHEDLRKILSRVSPAEGELDLAEAVLFGEPSSEEPQRACFHLDSAFQGQEGLAKARQALAEGRPYATAFVDVRMPPGWDGVETITHLWKEDPELQVVICTAYSDYSWEEITRHLGHSDNLVILKKPFDNIEVLQLAHALTKKWLLIQQAKRQVEHLDGLVLERTHELRAAHERLKSEIVERTEAEQALRWSEERFAKAFQASPIPMAIQPCKEERFADVNDRFLQMTGFRRDEVIGKTATELQLWSDLMTRVKLQQQLAAATSVRDLECQITTKAGEQRQAIVFVECFELTREPCLLLIIQDVTERTQLENQLRQAQKMEAVGQLAAGVAHDFNNILTVIQGHATLRLSKPNLDCEIAHSLKQVSLAAERAGTLIRQLLAYSRKQVMQLRSLNLNDLIRQMSDMLRRLIGEHIELQCELAEGLPAARADASNLDQVIMNLSVNARDAMTQGGRLTLRTAVVTIDAQHVRRHSAARPGQFVRLSAIDTGCGMDAATQRRIFEPFFTTKGPGKGTGMGLATVQGVVKQHQGWVEVTSEVGCGTTFQIFLPLADGAAPATTATPQPASFAQVAGGKNTVLVVEDEELVRELVRDALADYGYCVLLAGNGPEALRVWEQHRGAIELLLTDIVMPGAMSGWELAARLIKEKAALKVIYTSGYSEELVRRDFERDGEYRFLAKPYTMQQMAATVHSALNN